MMTLEPRRIPTIDDLNAMYSNSNGGGNEPPAGNGHHRNGDGEPLSTGLYIDWGTFWDRDRTHSDWLVDNVLARGRGHSIYAGRKLGKSLLALSLVAPLAIHPHHQIVVIYLDYEMGEDDLYERLEDMGYGPETDLQRLRYALLPTLPPLDTKPGADEIERILNTQQALHPDHHIVVIIDTLSRAVSGDENDASTVQGFYRHTGLLLKQRGVTWARLDHAGKDAEKGQRGSSAKGDDVDVVWRLTRTDQGVTLNRDLARMSWVPERVDFHQHDDPLRFTPVAGSWPAGTAEVANLLDRLGIPANTSSRAAGQALTDSGQGRRAEIVRAAVRFRQGSEYAQTRAHNPVDNSNEAVDKARPEKWDAHEVQTGDAVPDAGDENQC